MYNIKKNSCTKECYKYNKRTYIKKKQNTTYFHYNKYNKYKSKYNYSNTFSYNSYEYDYENKYFEKNCEKTKKTKKKELKEVKESNLDKQDENKENSSSYENSTINEYQTQEKTNNKIIVKKNNSYNIIEEDKSSIIEQDINSSESNTIIFPSCNSFCKTNSQIFSDDKENIPPNINTNYNNFINNKNFKELKEYNISSINITSQEFKEAFYVPKRLNNLYNMYSNNNNNQIINKDRKINENNFKNSSSLSLGSTLGIINMLNQNNLLQNNNNQNLNGFNSLLNNNNLFCNQNLNLNINNSSIIDAIQPFNLYDSINENSFHKLNSLDSFHSSLKAQINNSIIENEKERENTDILEINVKIAEKKTLIFKIRRYDDMFKTVKIFCEINKLDTMLIRPFIVYIIKALNSIYGIYNLSLKSEEIRFLKDIKKYFFSENKDEEQTNCINNEENEFNMSYEKERI